SAAVSMRRQEAAEVSGDGDQPEHHDADGEALLHLPLRGLDVLAAVVVPHLGGEKCQDQKSGKERVGEKRPHQYLPRVGRASRRGGSRRESAPTMILTSA